LTAVVTATISIRGRKVTVDARWDNEAGVWIATGRNVDGLAVEADTLPAMIEETRLIVPELLELLSAANARLPDVR
jgi:hypothetical protein